MRYATKDDLVDLFGEAKSKYGTLDPNGGLKRTGNGLSVDYSEVASVDALEDATALSPTGGIVSTQDGLAISPEQSSTGAIDGALLELTAKSKPATQQSTTGKNLFNKDGTILNAYINKDNSSISSNSIDRTAIVQVGPNTTYTISGEQKPIGSAEDNWYILEFDSLPTPGSRGIAGSLISVTTSLMSKTFTTTADTAYIAIKFANINKTDADATLETIQLELGSTATPYEPYSGGAPSPSPDYPQPIVTVRGRNLLNPDLFEDNKYQSNSGPAYAIRSNTTAWIVGLQKVSASTQYTLSHSTVYDFVVCYNASSVAFGYVTVSNRTFTTLANTEYVCFSFLRSEVHFASQVQLTEGSTPQPYVPYGHVGLERRDSQGNLLDTTPIPLPSRGWVAGLPDGTADELTVDGAGKVVWSKQTEEVVFDGSSDEAIRVESSDSNRIFLNVIFYQKAARTMKFYISHYKTISNGESYNARWNNVAYNSADGVLCIHDTANVASYRSWLSIHPVTVLYPLATPVTEDCGYIDLPDTQDCVLSIPELDALGVRYTIGDGAEIARQWYARAHSEYEQRITDLEEAVAELVAGA